MDNKNDKEHQKMLNGIRDEIVDILKGNGIECERKYNSVLTTKNPQSIIHIIKNIIWVGLEIPNIDWVHHSGPGTWIRDRTYDLIIDLADPNCFNKLVEHVSKYAK